MQVQTPHRSALIAVRNNKSGPTVFRDQATDTSISWEGLGDPSGADVQQVPDWVINHPAFAASLRKGVFTLISDEEAAEALRSTPVERDSSLAAQAQAAFQPAQVNDFIQVACVGPGPRAGSSCPTVAYQRQSDAKSAPPLCDAHKHLAHTFVPQEQPDPQTGLSRTVWTMASMAPRITQQDQAGAPQAPPTA